ncbi:MAG: hypothetical protein Q9163_002960 [Psora crenata]
MSVSEGQLVHHLNDHIFISHYHDPGDGFSNLEGGSEWIEDDRASMASVAHGGVVEESLKRSGSVMFSEEAVQDRVQKINVNVEISTYLQNIVVFLRMHRAVKGGITPLATSHFDILVKIRITRPELERSMQYGSDLAAVTEILETYTPHLVIDEVLDQVEVPL